jgi:hypothetical protein
MARIFVLPILMSCGPLVSIQRKAEVDTIARHNAGITLSWLRVMDTYLQVH